MTDNEVCVFEDDTTAHAGTPAVTNHDECSGETAVTNGGAGEDWADDWVFGDQTDINGVSFCFQDDVRGFTADPLDDTGQAGADVTFLNQASGSWDDVVVFVGITLPGASATAGHVGDFQATLTITGTAVGSTCSGNVSAHGTVGNTRAGGGSSSCRTSTHCLEFLVLN